MAHDPDGLLEKLRIPLTDEESKSADAFEGECDDFLLLNWRDGAFITYVFSEEISLRVLHEVTRRFNDVGWSTFVTPSTDPEGNKNHSLPMITFWKRDPDTLDVSDRIQKSLTIM